MKHLLLLLFVSFLISCGSSDLMTPASYTFSKIEIANTTAYTYSNNSYEEITLEEAGEPNISGMNGNIEVLELIDDSNLRFDDGFGEVQETYTISGSKIEFIANGSSYSMEILNDGQQLSIQRVGGGDFGELNPYPTVSATCEDEGCDDVDPSGYVYSSAEGDVGYVIIYNEVYNRN